MTSQYIPISCAFHDELEALATLHRLCVVVFKTDSGGVETVTDVIEDVYAQQHEEFARFRSGLVIRLDALIEVDGKPLPPPGDG